MEAIFINVSIDWRQSFTSSFNIFVFNVFSWQRLSIIQFTSENPFRLSHEYLKDIQSMQLFILRKMQL